MPEGFEMSTIVFATPKRIYEAWLNSEEHTNMTGSTADVSAESGASFIAWDGYITGVNLKLEPFHRIVQSWRNSEFPEGVPASRLEIQLNRTRDQLAGITVIIKHTDVPDGQRDSLKKGWTETYFEPMKEYFARGNNRYMRPQSATTLRRPPNG